jgi:hypothetical protein
MNVAVPCLRLLAAAALMILMPASAAAGAISPYWLLAALIILTATSCGLQRFYSLWEVFACAASIALMLGTISLATFAGLSFAAALQ